MKLLIATGIYPPDIGGPATYSKIIADEFSGLGHKVTVLTYADENSSNRKARGEKHEAQGPGFRVQIISRNIPKGIRHFVYSMHVFWHAKMADIIFAQDPVSAGLPALFTAKLLGKRFAVKIVGDYAWEQGQIRFGVTDSLDVFLRKDYGFAVEALRFFEKFVVRHADRIIVPSEYLKEIVVLWGAVPGSVVVIPNAVASVALADKGKSRNSLGLKGDILLSIGRFVPWKGFEMLVRILAEMRKANDNFSLVLIGDGPDLPKIKELAGTLGVSESVKFIGRQSKNKLAQYYSAADVFLLNTEYEGFSHQIIEAMAYGIPVVSTSAGGNKEVLKHGRNALVVSYNDAEAWKSAVNKIFEETELRGKLTSGGLETISRYSVEKMISATKAALETA